MSRKDVLSEGELDALMDSVSSGDVPLDDDGTGADCKPFDFTTREQSLLAQMPALKSINERHAAALAQGIRELFRIPVEVEPKSLGLAKLGDAFMAVPEPSAVNIVKTLPMNGVSYLIVPGEMTSLFVDQYFGGSSASKRTRPTGADLTPTEKRLNEVLVTRFLQTLQVAWSDKLALTAELVSTETNPDFSQMAPPEQLAVTFGFETRCNDWSASIDWVVPYALLEPLRPKLGSPSAALPAPGANTDWREHILAGLPSVELDISATFSSEVVSIAQILGLKRGAIVPLKAPSHVTVSIEGEPFCHGEYGALRGKKSIKITDFLQQLPDAK
tara:strand:- start:125306 stop:126295 length:990 start_codon:yes stop_codon:yes gene_type:complete